MTLAERNLAERLKDHETILLEKYKSLNGKQYYKCKTTNGKPLQLITKTLFGVLERRNNVIHDCAEKEWKFTLNVLQLRANLLDWQVKKDNRKPVKPRKIKSSIPEPF